MDSGRENWREPITPSGSEPEPAPTKNANMLRFALQLSTTCGSGQEQHPVSLNYVKSQLIVPTKFVRGPSGSAGS